MQASRVVIAVVLFCGAVGVALAQPVGGDSSGETSAEQSQGEPAGDESPVSPPSVQDLLNRIASALETANDKPSPADERERAERDLAAQERMAWWAIWMFGAVVAQIILTAVGIFLIWRTLAHTRTAAIAAQESVAEARKATDAASLSAQWAEESVKVVQDTAKRELRAYVCNYETFVGSLWDKGSLAAVAIIVKWKNFGKTPAVWCNTFIDSRHLEKGEPEANVVFTTKDRDKMNSGFIGPDVHMESAGILVERRTLDHLVEGKTRLFIRSRVEYEDIFGKTHETSLCQEAIPHYLPSKATKEGNEQLLVFRGFSSDYNYGD